jgi:hypothetical protein
VKRRTIDIVCDVTGATTLFYELSLIPRELLITLLTSKVIIININIIIIMLSHGSEDTQNNPVSPACSA